MSSVVSVNRNAVENEAVRSLNEQVYNMHVLGYLKGTLHSVQIRRLCPHKEVSQMDG